MKSFPTILLVLFAIQHSMSQDITIASYHGCLDQYINEHGNPAKFRDCVIGTQAPIFSAVSTNGVAYNSGDLKGKIVLLNFWYTTCGPCIKEIPILNSLYENLKSEDFEIVSFAPNDTETIHHFLKKYPIAFPIVADSRLLIDQHFQINAIGYPINILIDQDGTIIEFRWTVKSEKDLEALIRKSSTY